MLSLLERKISVAERRFLLLAPAAWPAPDCFSNVLVDRRRRTQLVSDVQRMRGHVYLRDGAIQPHELSAGRLHRIPQDERSWHLLQLDEERRIVGCIWYLEHDRPTTIDDLRVHASPPVLNVEWGPKVRTAIEADIARAQDEGVAYGEVGGWAVSDRNHCPADGFLLAVAAFGLSRLLGHAVGVTTATCRHSSNLILRRLGLRPFDVDGVRLPRYFDPKYGCDMDLLRFDSRVATRRYDRIIELFRSRLAEVPVVSATQHVERTYGLPYPIETEPVYAA